MSSIGQFGISAYDAPLNVRMRFLRSTYAHLTGAIGVFVLLSAIFQASGLGRSVLELMADAGRGWLLFLGGFMIIGWGARALSRSDKSPAINYLGLGIYTCLWSFFFSPLIYVASVETPGALPSAAIVTLLTFGGLTAYVFTTNKDFTWLGPALAVTGIAALGLIVCSVIFGFNLGIWFSGAMVLFSIGSTLYSTSKVLHIYRADQPVAAATELFADIALMFWYVLRLFMQLRR